VKAFLDDRDPKKRARLIDRLLQRDEFADFWTLKWGDLLRIKSEYPVRLWPKAVQTYDRWLREAIAENRPYDRFVRELLTSSGSNFRDGPANYYRAVPTKDPQTIGETTALVFLGARIGCARCHGHPQESWSLDDDLGLAAFFAGVAYKPTSEWKEEVVYLRPNAVLRNPRTREVVKPKLPGGDVVTIEPGTDPRAVFTAWLTAPDNPWFARNIVNRVWYWLLGRGIVHEPDDLRPSNPPENPALLDYLAAELVGHKFDLKHVYRLILNSRVYQLSSTPLAGNADDVAHFSHYPLKRLGAEPLLDAISRVTETSETFMSRIPEPYARLPQGSGATQLADGSIDSPFLELFGRPPRDTAFEGDRCSETSLRQAMYFVNSEHLDGKIAASPRIKRLLDTKASDADVVSEIYLSALSRPPGPDERQTLESFLAAAQAARAQAVRDLVWAIVNSNEFLFNH
jgi:hypothetical protein